MNSYRRKRHAVLYPKKLLHHINGIPRMPGCSNFLLKNVMICCIKCLGEVNEYSRTYSSFFKAFEIVSTRHVSASSSEWPQRNPNWYWYGNGCFFTNDNRRLYIRPSIILKKRGSTVKGRKIENTMGSFDLNNGITFATLSSCGKNVCDSQAWHMP